MTDETPNATTVKLVSSDGRIFVVEREVAMVSNTIRSMLTPIEGGAQFQEQLDGEIPLRSISGPVLERVIAYFRYKLKYTNAVGEIPPFDIEPEYALELLMAANFLDT